MGSHDADPKETKEDLLETDESEVIAEGKRGRYQFLLYLVSVPFWMLCIWVLPEYTSGTVTALVGTAGVILTVVAILRLSPTIAERLKISVVVFSIPYWLLAIFYASTQMMPRSQYAIAFLGGTLLLFVLMELREPVEKKSRAEAGLLLVSGLISAVTCVYLFVNYQRVAVDTIGTVTEFEIVLAVFFTVAISYLTWRAFGWTFLIVVIGGIFYGVGGSLIPGTLGHAGLTSTRVLRILVIETQGFFGFLTELVAAWIALFLLYAGLLRAYGAFDLILRLAIRSSKYVSSGVAQTAVLASAIIGSVNGSQTANAGMTGSFTIPLMKENGVRAETAGGIESVASTSGQVLPPVMGAAAFIMASLVSGITYVDVIIAGLIPAVILVVSTVIAVHYVASPQVDDTSMTDFLENPLSNQEMVLETIKYGAPLMVLIYALGIRQVTVMTAALWTVVSMIAFGYAVPITKALIENKSVGSTLNRTTQETFDGLRQGTIVVAPVMIILAAINGVVDILTGTGVPTALSLALMDLSGGIMIIAVFLAMVICIILGLGMPTTAAYTIVALLIAPTLISDFFVPELAAHFFVFYAAILSGLTPPIATCIAVTTGISGGGFWGTCKEAFRISAPLFVLPFAFVYHPELVTGGLDSTTAVAASFTIFGAISIIHGMNYPMASGRTVKYFLRLAFFVGGVVAMVHPDNLVQTVAIAGVLGLYAFQVLKSKPSGIANLKNAWLKLVRQK